MRREDYLTGESVFIAAGRAERPNDFGLEPPVPRENAQCPFCPEHLRERADILYRSASGRVTALPNRYPFFEASYGRHEVLADTNLHCEEFADFNLANMTESVMALKLRCAALAAVPGTRYVQVFKNNGKMAGASLSHSHWQLCALPFVPDKLERICENAGRFHAEHGVGYWEHELRARPELVIYTNAGFAALSPYAPRFDYETVICPLKPIPSLADLGAEDVPSLAKALKASLTALRRTFPADYNILVVDPPLGATGDFRFYIRIIPRRGGLAGLELSTGLSVVTAPPEDAARILRGIITEQKRETGV